MRQSVEKTKKARHCRMLHNKNAMLICHDHNTFKKYKMLYMDFALFLFTNVISHGIKEMPKRNFVRIYHSSGTQTPKYNHIPR